MRKKQKLSSGLHALLWQEDKWFVAKCVEVEIASQGKNKKEALSNLEEALDLYFEDEKLSPPRKFSMLELHDIPLKFTYA